MPRALRWIALIALLAAAILCAPASASTRLSGSSGSSASGGSTGGTSGGVTAPGSDDCLPTDQACFDALPADSVWEQAIDLPGVPGKYKGDGLTVASIDTGVAPNPDLGARLLARVDLTSEHDGIDRFGHGTHMAGLIAGDGTTSAEAYEGAAPETNLVSVKVAGWDGASDVSTVIAGLHWVVANRDRYGIRVVNLSWGTDAPRGYGNDPLDLAVERAWRAGIVVVVAAGNAGPTAGTVTKPGDDPFVLTVGAADTQGTATTADDTVADFSSRGPTADGLGKPDVLAPGMSLVSDRVPGSTVDAFRPAARVGTAMFKGSGTSQAAAITSGVVARLLEANPALTPNQVKGVLMATANPVPGPGAGAGLIDAAAAVARATAGGALPAANAGLAASTGSGPIAGSRGTFPAFRDLDGDGVADPLTGEVDALGRPWDPSAYAAATWSAATWAASPWAPVTAVVAGSGPAPAWTGPALAPLAWEAAYWGALSWQQAGWDAKYWGAKYWGAKYWGTGLWQ